MATYMSKLHVDETYIVEPTEILPFGVKVYIPELKEHNFVHISNIIPGFCKDINEHVVIGQKYKAWAVEGHVKPIELKLYDPEE